MRIPIFGGTGFLGRSLAIYLAGKGYEPIMLARNPPAPQLLKAQPELRNIPFVRWNGYETGEWAKVLEGAMAIVNLAGRSVDCVKTPANVDTILRSRVDSVRAIGAALRETTVPPPVWVQMSTAHIYGDSEDRWCSEDSTLGYGLAPDVGRAWERAFAEERPEGMRGVVLRTSFVVGRGGGAMSRLGPLAKLGLGGTIGNGRQGMSWIHLEDMNRLFLRAIESGNVSATMSVGSLPLGGLGGESQRTRLVGQSPENSEMRGVYIASAPNPVSNREFMRALRKAVGMPLGLPAPGFAVSIGAKLMNTDPELALYGRYVYSERLAAEGFAFRYEELADAFGELYGTNSTPSHL